MKVIILAAGYGSRMYPLAQEMPKCLLPINKETILDRQLRILKKCGLMDITIVAGFHKEKIIEQVGEEVAVRYNPHYEITGNLFTLWVVRDLLDSDTIIMNADLVFTEQAIDNILSNKSGICLLVDPNGECDSEAQKVTVDSGLVSSVSKNILMDEAYGEFAYIMLIRKRCIAFFKEALTQSVKHNTNARFTEPINLMAKQGHKVGYALVDSPWMEVDTKEDYEELLRKW